ncbi:unnamed protein product [Rhizoctonia solani]|uniref:MIF4G domain-containing protein n=1 Tax=Rhizoctonia solani TaxID=456999 RepID=A0A8H3GDB1_9AGAM|nr:unnamed protein product [Rhizoctonia solani]
MTPPDPRLDEFQLRLAHCLLDQLGSHGEFETVAQHFRLLISQTQERTLGELYEHIGRLVLRRISQSQLESYNDEVQLYAELCYCLFSTHFEHHSSLSPQVMFIHEHIFRLCVDSLSVENILEPSSTWDNGESTTGFSAPPELNGKYASVEKNSELLFYLYTFRLISLAQISEYIFRVIKSYGASVGTRLTSAVASVRLLTKLFPNHSHGPWKKEVNSFNRWTHVHSSLDKYSAKTIVENTSHNQETLDITSEENIERIGSPSLLDNGRKFPLFNSFNASIGPEERFNSFGSQHLEVETTVTGNNLGKHPATPSTSSSLDPASGLSPPPSEDLSVLEGQGPSPLKPTSLQTGEQRNERCTEAHKVKGEILDKLEGEREQAERKARDEACKADEEVGTKARIDKIREDGNGGERSRQARRRAKKNAVKAKKEAERKVREGAEDGTLSTAEETKTKGKVKEVSHPSPMKRDSSQGDVGGGDIREAEPGRDHVDSVSASGLQTHPSRTTNLGPVTPLRPTINRWVSRSRMLALQRLEGRRLVDRKVKALLNKFTMENFDSISDQIIEWANKSEQETDGSTLMQVIKLVFERAKDEAVFSEMYARLCRKMMERVSPYVQDRTIRNMEGRPITGGMLFRKYLLNRCQEDFERGWSARRVILAAAVTKTREDKAADVVSEGNGEAVLYSGEYYAAAKAKRQGLGLVRFIGELFKLQMLTERIMHECIKKLLSNILNPEEEEIESLCELLKTVGQSLDNPKARNHMDIYFERMQEMAKGSNINSRMQFKLLDVIELRARHWQARSAVPRSKLTRQCSSDDDSSQHGEHPGPNCTERDSWYTVISMFLKYY